MKLKLVLTGIMGLCLSACNDSTKTETVEVEKIVVVGGSTTTVPDKQPSYQQEVRDLISERVEAYKVVNYQTNYRDAYNYDAKGSYLGYGTHGRSCTDSAMEGRENIRLNEDGIVEFKTKEDGFMTSPVSSAQCGLQEYFKQGRQITDVVQAYIDDLIASQNGQGGYQYMFNYNYRGEVYSPGWVSGMAQGQVLSFFTRVLQDNDSPEMYDSAKRAFEFLITPVEQGGTMSTMGDIDESLDDYIFFEEIVSKTDTQSHILNGYIFAMLGAYDWWQMDPTATEGTHYEAKIYFDASVETLIKVLPYYDAIGYSLYDIWHLSDDTKDIEVAHDSYHYTHIYLLQALLGITDDALIGYVLRRWQADVGNVEIYERQ